MTAAAVPQKDADGRAGMQSIRELMRKKLPPTRWFLPGIIPLRGVTLFFAGQKSGKSALILGAIISAAHNDKILNHWQPDGEIGTAYLDLETPEREAQERVAAILAGRELPHRLDIVCADSEFEGAAGWPRMNEGGLEKLDRYLAHHNVELVVIDTWGLFKPSTGNAGGRYSYDRDVAEVQQLKVLAARHNIGIFLVHHTNKSADPDWTRRASGTSGLTGSCDTLVYLERPRGGTTAILQSTGRYVRDSRHRLAFNAALLTFTYLCDADTTDTSEARMLIIEILTGLDDALRPVEIAARVGKTPGAVRRLLATMLRDGQVLRTDDRRYVVPLEG